MSCISQFSAVTVGFICEGVLCSFARNPRPSGGAPRPFDDVFVMLCGRPPRNLVVRVFFAQSPAPHGKGLAPCDDALARFDDAPLRSGDDASRFDSGAGALDNRSGFECTQGQVGKSAQVVLPVPPIPP